MKKLSLINVADYPSSQYRAYWEIQLDSSNWAWEARILSVPASDVLATASGQGTDEEDARRQSQTWVLGEMPQYKRED